MEDNKINQELARELLEINGITVEVANDGQEAIDKLQESKYDGVLMDCQMPILDGYATTEVIRNQLSQTLPILAMTANVMAGDKEKALKAGMNDLIGKPINVNDMFSRMAKWFVPDKNIINLEHVNLNTAPIIQCVSSNADRLVIDKLAQCKGIDTEEGLKTMMGNEKLYIKLLSDFSNSYENVNLTEQFTLLGEPILALKTFEFIHTLKGLSGNLRLHPIYQQSGIVEQTLKCSNDAEHDERIDHKVIEQELFILNDLLNATVADIKATLTIAGDENLLLHDGGTIEEPNDEKNNLFDQGLYQRLVHLLEGQDTEALTLIESINHSSSIGLTASALKDCEKALHQFDFDEALHIIKRLG